MAGENGVSIIIPVYNVEDKISGCIDSILNQTFQDFELILVNDGSSDNSSQVCWNYSKKDSRIFVIDKKNEGAGYARNAGLDIATKKYVVFIDSDDWIEPDMLQSLLSLINTSDDIQVVSCNYYCEIQGWDDPIIVNIDMPEDPWITEDVAQCIAYMDKVKSFNYLWNKIYLKSIIDEHNIRFEKFFTTGQDLDFNLKYFRHVKKCVVTNVPYYHYIKDGVNSLCARYKDNLYNIVSELSSRRWDMYKEFDMDQNKEYVSIYAMTHIDYIRSCVPNMFRKNAKFSRKERYEQMDIVINDAVVKKYISDYSPSSKLDKIFKKIVLIGNTRIAIMVYSVLFFIRNNLSGLYKKIIQRLNSNNN